MSLSSIPQRPRTIFERKTLVAVIPAMLFLFPGDAVEAAGVVADISFIVGVQVPDNSAVGLSDTRFLDSAITSISDVSVTLRLSGGWAGDLYAYVVHGSGFAVLLNRPGRSAARPDGFEAGSIDVTLTDDSLADIHQALLVGGTLSGFFQPDGRNLDPATVFESGARSANLDAFKGLDANGAWTLFVADVAAGDTMVLESWTLTINGVPEPSTLLLAAAGLPLLLNRRRTSGAGGRRAGSPEVF